MNGPALKCIERKRVERFKLRDSIAESARLAGSMSIRQNGRSFEEFRGGYAG